MDAGFLSVVEIGQYIRTKDTADLSQFHAVACREYTLPREEEEEASKIGPVFKVANGVEIRIWSLKRDNTHSWVRSNKFVMNLNNHETEIPEVQPGEYALKRNAKILHADQRQKQNH